LPLNNTKQIKDFDNPIKFSNHKGTKQQQELLLKLAKDNINRGFTLPLPLNKISLIPDVVLAPLNIQLQKMINKKGEIIPKNRLTHNQSWTWQSGTSVNSRVNAKKLMPYYFGKALKHLINWAKTAPPKQKNTHKKMDIKAAFQ
jgi:hypothetical protein